MAQARVREGYAADAAELIPRFEMLKTEDVLAPVLDLLPSHGCRILEIGAGTGRDAAWLAARGHRMLAVEPAGALRNAGRSLHPSPQIEWLDDELPLLRQTQARGERFDIFLSVAVWQHLPPEQHGQAIGTLASLAAPDGRVILSIRRGPGAPNRPCFAADPDVLVAEGAAAGLRLVAQREAPSVQQRNRDAGVTWDWLCFERLR